MKQVLMAAAATSVMAFASCNKSNDDLAGTFNGDEVAMGKGKAYTWMQTDDQGKPIAVGFSLTDAALTGLPDDHETEEMQFEMQLPVKTFNTIFNHVVIDWNPHGHPPGFYLEPHFDFHFYTISSTDRKTIPVYEADSNAFKNAPSPEYLPANYISTGGGVPEMGTHWVDVTSPELNGHPFTQTLIYGTYNGKVNFIEPMITLSYLQSITVFERSVPRPAKVMTSGYYPQKLRITHADGTYKVALEELEWRDKS